VEDLSSYDILPQGDVHACLPWGCLHYQTPAISFGSQEAAQQSKQKVSR
jgi:hypothetical protein